MGLKEASSEQFRVADRATPTSIHRRLPKLYFPTLRKMAVPSSSGLNQSRNWMKAPRSFGYYLRKDMASLPTGLEIFHFSPFLLVKKKVIASDSQLSRNVVTYPGRTMLPATYSQCTHYPRVQLKCDGTRWRTEGKRRGNWRMEWVASTLHTTSENGVSSITTADAHTSAVSSRLNWRPLTT